jgi:hypothetical protein
LPLIRYNYAPTRKPAPHRRIAAAVGAGIIQVLAAAVFIEFSEEPVPNNETEERAFTWLYLSPLAPPETPPEVELPEQPTPLILRTPEPEFDPYAVPLEDLRIVSVPTLRIIPYDEPGGGSVRLGLGAYFSCDISNYDSLSQEERTDCASRLAALQRERDLTNPDALLFVLTRDEMRQWNRWERDHADSQNGSTAPCMNARSFLTITTATIDCVVSNITDGYDTENNPQPRVGVDTE